MSSRPWPSITSRTTRWRAGLVNLIVRHHEVLAQDGQLASGARLHQVLGLALKELRIGQHAQASRAVLGIALGNGGRAEVRAQHALAGAGPF